MLSRVPAPTHRHAAPSGPWPFVDIDDEVDPSRIDDPDSHLPLSAAACDHKQTPNQEVCWCKYPQALYPNWTPRQQKKSRIAKVVEKRTESCTIRYLDVMKDGMFVNAGDREVNERTVDEHWHAIQRGRPSGVHVRALFVDGLSGPVLQILGTRYNIEPFFFSSTIGWIPSRHQTNVVPNESDHITITLTFIRSTPNPTTVPPSPEASYIAPSNFRRRIPEVVIDTRAPLVLRSSNLQLVADQLAVHMLRSRTSNTIISLHSPSQEQHRSTTAALLHTRVHATGRSVYWSNIFKDTTDPTFVFLSVLWYALYAWDEALEHLYNHICYLESQVILTSDLQLTHELHILRAHLLHYESLLTDFKKSVEFVQHTPNPSLQALDIEDEEAREMKKRSAATMKRECENLLTEIDRLQKSRSLQDMRLKNVMNLEFSIVNIEDSRGMQKLTEAAIRDSAAIKQISYMTMIFVPAGFVAAVFGMNVREINPMSYGTLAHYVAVAAPLTAFTIWIIIAYQIQIRDPQAAPSSDNDSNANLDDGASDFAYLGMPQKRNNVVFKRMDLWARLWWPVILFSTALERRKRRNEMRKPQTRIDTD